MTRVAKGLSVSARLAGQTVTVLRDLDFAIEPGKILGLVGVMLENRHCPDKISASFKHIEHRASVCVPLETSTHLIPATHRPLL